MTIFGSARYLRDKATLEFFENRFIFYGHLRLFLGFSASQIRGIAKLLIIFYY